MVRRSRSKEHAKGSRRRLPEQKCFVWHLLTVSTLRILAERKIVKMGGRVLQEAIVH